MKRADVAFQAAMEDFRAGMLDDAERKLTQILTSDPAHANTLHLLGVVAARTGQLDVAEDLIRRAIRFNPDVPIYHVNLGSVFRDQRLAIQALASYRSAVRIDPRCYDAHLGMGVVLTEQGDYSQGIESLEVARRLNPGSTQVLYNLALAFAGGARLAEAKAAYEQVLQREPRHFGACHNLALMATKAGEIDQAVSLFGRALELKNDAKAHAGLACALWEKGQVDDAISSYREALRLNPESSALHLGLGLMLRKAKRFEEGLAELSRAVELDGRSSEANFSLGNAFRSLGRFDEAMAAYRRAIELDGNYAGAYTNLANILRDQGQIDEALSAYQQAVRCEPGNPTFHSNLLYNINFHPDFGAAEILAAHREWDRRHAGHAHHLARPHLNRPDPERKLRIGYVSPDFRLHPLGLSMLQLLATHDRKVVEIYCYSAVDAQDAITDRLRPSADVWQDIRTLNDESAAELIRQDEIDILVDLALHTNGNRLKIFALKPAPIQMTMLGPRRQRDCLRWTTG